MPDGLNIVQTRQRPEVFFRTSIPLGAGQSHVSAVVLVAGYDGIKIFVISDQAFSVLVEESTESDGLYGVAATYASELVGFDHQLCEIHNPCGTYAKITISNTSGVSMQVLYATASGIAVA